MQNCIFPLDVFTIILSLPNEYLPVSTFLALRATCRQIKQLFTKQKYIDKYGRRIIEKEDNTDFVPIWIVKEYFILPNGALHGIVYEHIFDYEDGFAYLENDPKKLLARRYGLPDDTYYHATDSQLYYLGNIATPKVNNKMLLGNYAITRVLCVVDELYFSWSYIPEYTIDIDDSKVERNVSCHAAAVYVGGIGNFRHLTFWNHESDDRMIYSTELYGTNNSLLSFRIAERTNIDAKRNDYLKDDSQNYSMMSSVTFNINSDGGYDIARDRSDISQN